MYMTMTTYRDKTTDNEYTRPLLRQNVPGLLKSRRFDTISL